MTTFQLVLSGCSVNNPSSYNIDVAFDHSILHIMQYIIYLQYLYHIHALCAVPRPDKLFTKGLFMKFNGIVSLWFIE